MLPLVGNRNPHIMEKVVVFPAPLGSNKDLRSSKSPPRWPRATRLWPRLEAVYPPYATYRTQTSRAIVPVILEPRTSPSVDPG